MSFHSIKEREMKFHQCEKNKCASSLKNLKFIIPRGIQGSSKREFIEKGKNSSSIEKCKCTEATKNSRECIKMTENL